MGEGLGSRDSRIKVHRITHAGVRRAIYVEYQALRLLRVETLCKAQACKCNHELSQSCSVMWHHVLLVSEQDCNNSQKMVLMFMLRLSRERES